MPLFSDLPGAQRFPQFLQDDEHLVFAGAGGVHVGALSGGAATLLTESDTAAVVTRGHLLFVRRVRSMRFASTSSARPSTGSRSRLPTR